MAGSSPGKSESQLSSQRSSFGDEDAMVPFNTYIFNNG